MTQAITVYFLNSLWQVPLLAGGAWLMQRWVRPGARARYCLWIVTLLLAVALPGRGAMQPAASAVDTVSAADYDGPLPTLPVRAKRVAIFTLTVPPRIASALAGVYLLMLTICVVRLGRAHLVARRLVEGSTVWPGAVEAGPKIRVLPAGHGTPMVTGIFRPTILLPAALLSAPRDQLEAVLAHEGVHVERRDLLCNALLQGLSLPIAYHPATAVLHSQVSRARELLVDTRAAQRVASASGYAASLLALADHIIHPGATLTAGFFDNPSHVILEERIMNLINPQVPTRRMTRLARAAAALTVFASVTAVVTLCQLTPGVLASSSAVAQTPQTQTTGEKPAGAAAADPVAQGSSGSSGTAGRGSSTGATDAEPKHNGAVRRRHSAVVAGDDATLSPELRAELKRLSEEVARSAVNSAEFQRSMAEMRRQLESPEFKRQITEMTEQARKQALSAESQRKMAEEVERRVNSPEFQRQLAQIRIDTDALQKRMAESMAGTRAELNASAQGGPVRVASGVVAGQRESGSSPVYPPDAKAAHISGAVVLHAIISKDGSIESLQVISGPVELQQSALDAVKTWQYKPYLLNGEPTEVETTIEVNYSLTH